MWQLQDYLVLPPPPPLPARHSVRTGTSYLQSQVLHHCQNAPDFLSVTWKLSFCGSSCPPPPLPISPVRLLITDNPLHGCSWNQKKSELHPSLSVLAVSSPWLKKIFLEIATLCPALPELWHPVCVWGLCYLMFLPLKTKKSLACIFNPVWK